MHRKIPAFTIGFALCLGSSTLCGTAMADPSPEDARDYRLALMTALRGHVGAISMNVRGLVEDHGFLAKHAEALASTAAELAHAFPAGSNVGDSEALPEIWAEPDKFAQALNEAKEATAAFSEAAAGGDEDAIEAAFRDVGAACRGCHDRFRKDDD